MFVFGLAVGAAVVSVIWTLWEDHKFESYLNRLDSYCKRLDGEDYVETDRFN